MNELDKFKQYIYIIELDNYILIYFFTHTHTYIYIYIYK